MKRLFVLGLAIMALGANVFASGNEVINKLNDDTVFRGMVRYLDAGYQQTNDLRYVFSESARIYNKATAKGMNTAEASQKAFNFNLANARAILSPEQYKKFVRVLNISVNNEINKSLLAEK